MGFIEFLIICVVAIVIAAMANWVIDQFAPGHPPIVNRIIWGVAVLIIVWLLLTATGILGHDVKIPHI